MAAPLHTTDSKPSDSSKIQLEGLKEFFPIDDFVLTWTGSAAFHATNAMRDFTNALANKELFDAIGKLNCHSGGNKFCEEMAHKIVNNKSVLESFKELFEGFGDHFTNEIGQNMGESLSGAKKAVESVCKKSKELAPKCRGKGYAKHLSKIRGQYFMLSAASLLFSFFTMYQTYQTLEESSKALAKYQQKFDNLRIEYIQPILDYHGKILAEGRVTKWNEYVKYSAKIKTAIDLLNEYKDGIEKEKQRMQTKGVNSAVSSIVMAFSAVTTFGLGGGFWMKALGTGQTVAAVGHGVQAIQCGIQWNKLQEINTKIKRDITTLEGIMVSLERHRPYPQECDDVEVGDYSNVEANSWDNNRVVQWINTLSTTNKYAQIAQIFKDNEIEGPDLLDMDHDTLKSLGIDNLFLRKQFLRKISTLF